MAIIPALERTLNSLDEVPTGSRDLIEWMNKLYLLYLNIGYLKEEEIYHPLNHDFYVDPLPWQGQDWDERILGALPWLPTVSYAHEGGPHITPGAPGYAFHSRDFARDSRKLFGCLDYVDETMPNWALPLTDGNKWADHWIWDAKEGLIRTYDYEGDVVKFEEMPGTSVKEKFSLLIHSIEDLETVPWCGQLCTHPRLDLMRQSRELGDPRWSFDANMFIVAKIAYLEAGWGGDGEGLYDPRAFQLVDFLVFKDEWDQRMEAIKHLDGGDFDQAESDVAAEMAGSEAYR